MFDSKVPRINRQILLTGMNLGHLGGGTMVTLAGTANLRCAIWLVNQQHRVSVRRCRDRHLGQMKVHMARCCSVAAPERHPCGVWRRSRRRHSSWKFVDRVAPKALAVLGSAPGDLKLSLRAVPRRRTRPLCRMD
jgi:hypothetical protein